MAASAVEIINRALAAAGSTQPITSLAENTAEARMGGLHYGPALARLLAMVPWHFATRRASLSPLASPRSGWAYAYALPAAFLGWPRLSPGNRRYELEAQPPFEIENDAVTGRALLCDVEELEISYVANITDTTHFPPLFEEALVQLLAAELAIALALKESYEQRARARFEQALSRAREEQVRSRYAPAAIDSVLAARYA